MNTLAGKTALITGASRGIGACLVQALVAAGATVVGVARSQDSLDQLCADLKAQGSTVIGIAFDLSRVDELSLLVEQVQRRVGAVDILVNNAAIEKYASFSQYSSSDIQSILATNLLAAMELGRLLLPDMLRRRQGHIVNIASLAGKKGAPYNSIYSASKAGLILWTDALRQELVGTGVNVSAICPGYVSQAGMTVDTQVPIPPLAGKSTPAKVTAAVMRAVTQNQAELIVNQNSVTEYLTRLLFALGQIAPHWSDRVYRWLGVTHLNRMRVRQTLPNSLDTVERSP
ncbi:MAG: SDR family NAD(P)-dependent oxidoreductase [Elainellaceae cyanobacterium]